MKSASTRLPLFPLNTVVFPGGLLALRLFETRYVDMARRCLREGTGFVVVATTVSEATLAAEAQRATLRTAPPSAGSATVHLDDAVTVPYDPGFGFAGIGTEVRIIEADLRSDGLLGIECEGVERVRIAQVSRQRDGLWLGDVQPNPADADHRTPVDALIQLARGLAERLTATGDGALIQRGARLRTAAETRSSHALVGRLAELLPLGLADRQALLDIDDPLARCTRLTALLIPDDDPSDDPSNDPSNAPGNDSRDNDQNNGPDGTPKR